MTFKILFRSAAACAVLGFAGATPALAQDAQTYAPPPAAAMTEVSDAEISAYVEASTQIRDISARLQPQAEAAQSQEEMQQVQAQAQTEMVAAVESAGMTPDRYNEITAAAQADAALAQRITAQMPD